MYEEAISALMQCQNNQCYGNTQRLRKIKGYFLRVEPGIHIQKAKE
ncbi:hypothetical protein EC12741_1217 [Escherichia coli 1.2741]|nr:hypothetical protein EC12741_1217 [Escherichia coli 1.2741]